MNLNRKTLVAIVIWSTLLMLALAGYWTMQKSSNRLNAAMLQLEQCELLAADIQTLKDRPGFAALGVDSPRTITERAELAVAATQIQSSALSRIEPQPAIRLRDSDYRLRPTRLELRRVTLEQVLTFALAMVDEAQGTIVRDLRLTQSDAGQNVQDTDAWTAELVLTQLIFSPPRR